MANTPNITDEEIQFRKRARRRLVGAVVLVLLVVVVVPWLLPADRPPQEAQPIDIRIPSQDATGFTPKIQPTGQPQAPASAGVSAAPQQGIPEEKTRLGAGQNPEAVATETQPHNTAQEKSAAQDKPPPKAKAAPQEKTAASPPAEAGGERFYVQFGAFSEAKNAAQRQAELKAKGIASFTEVVKTSAGDKIRVRSGPYDSREAERIQLKARPLESKLVPINGG